jgi:hypothetical protein
MIHLIAKHCFSQKGMNTLGGNFQIVNYTTVREDYQNGNPPIMTSHHIICRYVHMKIYDNDKPDAFIFFLM